MSVYNPPKSKAPIDIKLDANEGILVDSELPLNILKENPGIVSRYPDKSKLEKLIAGELGLKESRVIVCAGGDNAIELIFQKTVNKNDEVILPNPSFVMLDIYAKKYKADTLNIEWTQGYCPVEKIIKKISDKTKLIAVVSPNNPTGLTIKKDDLLFLSKTTKSINSNAMILLDLAYIEFAGEDLTGTAIDLDNVVIIRTFSKAWGLAGLRVGYAIGQESFVQSLKDIENPYPVSSLSLEIAYRSYKSKEQKNFVQNVIKQRKEFIQLLNSLNIRYLPSEANFVMAGFDNPQWTFASLAALGIAVRIFPDNELMKNYVRISLPGEEKSFQKLCNAVKTITIPDTLLFDIDNTLVDVSDSYRKAIISTSEYFGVKAGNKEIEDILAQGNANNDWELSHRIILNAGKNIEFEEVKNVFEDYYQGTDKIKGYKYSEKLTVDINFLKKLKEKFRLGLVTGRPKGDAENFIKQFKLEGIFSAIITMDDGKLKPSPEPVMLALKKLNSENAWMIGDTPDDIIAARLAGVLPLAVKGLDEEVLYCSGAACILNNIEDIKELLP